MEKIRSRQETQEIWSDYWYQSRLPKNGNYQRERETVCNEKNWIAKTVLKKTTKVGGNTLPNLKTYYKAIGIKLAWC